MTAPSTTTLTLANGVNFDLLNPVAADVSFEVICEHLAKANRYCGATPGAVYSVAQHCSLVAERVRDPGPRRQAALGRALRQL